MRPIIYSEYSGFLMTDGLIKRHEENVPEPGPQPGDEANATQANLARNTFGNRIKTFFGIRVPARSARARNGYQRNY